MNNILIITRNLPPLVGGMERLNWHIADELSKQNKVTIISHSAAKELAPKNVKFYKAPLNPLPLFLILSFIRAFWICITQPTDTLFAGSGLTAPIVVLLAKIFRKKSIVYIHGLDIDNNSLIYHNLWIPLIRKANKIIVNSTPTQELCIKKHIKVEKISIIHPGVTYPPSPPNIDNIRKLKEIFNLHEKKVLISIGRLTERKGLSEFIEQCFNKIISEYPNTVLLIVGDTATQALNKNLQTPDQLIELAKKNHTDKNIIFTGKVSDLELSSLLYLSDIHVFPVKHIPHDPEGFGMVAIEAAAHGTPTIAFATGGIVDAIKQDYSGLLITPNNYDLFTNSILDALKSQTISSDNCQQYAAQFSWQSLNQKLEQAMK
ncbi:glycosyltransferase family 4 protein [Acinetobacter brisouii]|uniref:glycosyltransferase family 4 protein n=1 Tax=Acinetobacter brisouii TaxID=396323 RepID=UPI0005F7AD7C|nr:glycosyltransferase family 4 protein [Acinetobacter brisouii]KJV41241.1 glycosyl transferase [Acinetobacter brisouii]